MRSISEIIIHCSATPAGRPVTAADIDLWHRQRGFTQIGYHYVILLDGTVQTGRPDDQIGAHCLSHNAHSIGICYIGGLTTDHRPADTRTPAQRAAMRRLVDQLLARYPAARVYGHNEFAPKACPCFNVKAEYRNE